MLWMAIGYGQRPHGSHFVSSAAADSAPRAAGPGIGHESTVWAVAFEPGGARAASVSDDRTLRLWRCGRAGSEPQWRLLACLAGCHTRAIFAVDWGAAGIVTGARRERGVAQGGPLFAAPTSTGRRCPAC